MGWGRLYFALQACLGALWWAAVFTLPGVRAATLGSLDPVAVAVADIPLFVVASALAAAGVRAAAAVSAAWATLVAVSLALWATVTSQAGAGVVAMGVAAAGSALALSLVLSGRIPTEWVAKGPFRFRPAASDASQGRHLVRTAGQIVVVWGLSLAVVPTLMVLLERRWRLALDLPDSIRALLVVVGTIVFVLASALGLWSAAVMSAQGDGSPLPATMPNRLVIAGPYRIIRNPMALSGVAQAIGVGLLLSSSMVVVYALVGGIVWNTAIRPVEERDLEERFGENFRRYRSAVRCWLPGRPRGQKPMAAR